MFGTGHFADDRHVRPAGAPDEQNDRQEHAGDDARLDADAEHDENGHRRNRGEQIGNELATIILAPPLERRYHPIRRNPHQAPSLASAAALRGLARSLSSRA